MKNKAISILSVFFSIFFIGFVVRITDNVSKANILNSPNIIEAGDLISSKIMVTGDDFPISSDWVKYNFNDQMWEKIKIPTYQVVRQEQFKKGNFVYYRIKIPKSSFKKIQHLKNESSIVLQSVFLAHFDVVINENFFRTFKPEKTGEHKLILPVDENKDNLIAIKGYIKSGDTGIDSRNKIMLGKGVEFNSIHSAEYKAQVVFQLVFILCKGSILFIFALIYLLLNVDRSFEKFFIFGLCAVIEELIAGDYLFGPLDFNQMVYLYNFVNVGGAISLFLFFGQLTKTGFRKRPVIIASFALLIISTLLASDALHGNYAVDLEKFMKFWNLFTVTILIFYLPKVFYSNKILSAGLLVSISLYLSGALLAHNIGLNLKAYGNLLLFFMVAYETFAIFRREQIQLQLKEKQLLEQEKDVAIGKTASLLAHDVRKPLDQMKLVIERLSSGQLDKGFLEIAKSDIDISIASVDQQVNDIINFSKASKVIYSDLSFYRILSHALKQVLAIHQEMNIELSYEFTADRMLIGDQGRLSNVLVNLLANAVEAIRDLGNRYTGRIHIETRIHNKDFIFSIFNDGPEIPKEIIDEIFKPLFTYGKAGGTGLGLASVAKTINEHHGSITVKNVSGRGVEFILHLNASKELDNPASYTFKNNSKLYHYVNSAITLTKENISIRILILEKDVVKVGEIQGKLSNSFFNFSIEVFSDVKEAEASIKKRRYDLYLLGLSSGGSDLYQTSLNFLSNEVFLFDNDLSQLKIDFKCQKISWNSLIENLSEICDRTFKSRKRILFVDDTKLFRISWQMFHGDHNILCLSSPEEALFLINEKKENFDAYVVDYHFSNSSMNGISLAFKIRDSIPDAIILISSSVELDNLNFQSISKKDYEIRKIIKT